MTIMLPIILVHENVKCDSRVSDVSTIYYLIDSLNLLYTGNYDGYSVVIFLKH